ncbi:MAG: ABC transporter permease [Candidatus Saccharimonadales bacterium]
MTSLIKSNAKMAYLSLRARRGRSFLTVLGIVIGISSVVTIVSIGLGIKQQIAGQINQLGGNLITVRSGSVNTGGSVSGTLGSLYLFGGPASSSDLTVQDFNLVHQTRGVAAATVMSLVPGKVSAGSSQDKSSLVIGSSVKAAQVLHQGLQYGSFFNAGSQYQNVAVLGQNVAAKLFPGQVPLGYSLKFHGQSFIVRGVLNKFDTSPLSLDANFNNAVFIPYPVAQGLANQKVPIYEILAKPGPKAQVSPIVNAINKKLTKAHEGAKNFSVLKQSDNLKIAGRVLDLLTSLIAGIAAISLLVAGIGIINVMLVSVSERTREIGVRKALGATNRQILDQFLTEAVILSLLGAAGGIILSLIVNALLRLTTALKPVLSWQVIVASAAVSIIIGIIFGIVPAAKAARKNPIDALRYQ